jgi:hypothetical protein
LGKSDMPRRLRSLTSSNDFQIADRIESSDEWYVRFSMWPILSKMASKTRSQSLWGQPNYEQFVVGKWVTLFCSE